MKKATILVYVSSASSIPLREGGINDAGVFLGELTEPLAPLLKSGHHFAFASPDGKAPVIDKNSYKLLYWGLSKKKLRQAIAIYHKLNDLGMKNPHKIDDLLKDERGLDEYNALFIPGGHAPMTDIVYKNWLEGEELNENTGKLLLHFHESNKPTALICHAPAALTCATDTNGGWIYKGYRMTCVSQMSEFITEDMPFMKVMHGHLLKYPTTLLKNKGARLKQVQIPMIPVIVEDRELLTGQDPYSAKKFGVRFKAKLEKYLSL